MNFIEPDYRNHPLSPALGDTSTGNYYAFFDKPVPENLAANRSGILSPQQQSALEKNIAYRKSTSAIILGMFFCAALAVFYFLWMVVRDNREITVMDLAFSGVVIAILLGLLASLLTGDLVVFFTGDDLENGAVESAAGRVVWNGRRYEMRSDVRRLRWLR